ncbi:MAG: hypothetical protein FGF48_11110 [Candidatus Brockarchaeota archaeon]|nr:hypothetical protein [Candidatus Brockarchaeota archaeon]
MAVAGYAAHSFAEKRRLSLGKFFRKREECQKRSNNRFLFGLTLKYSVMSDREKEFSPPSKISFEITRFPNGHDISMSGDESDSEEFEATPFVDIRINGVEMEGALVDGFFWKYGNSDGSNILGLTAEAHFVKKLRKLGYEVSLVISHNIEIREIKKGNFMYDCFRDYGEVVENMPRELKEVVKEFCKEGVDIRISDEDGIPVYLDGRFIFRAKFEEIILHMLSKIEDEFITNAVLFDPRMEEFEPFLIALSYELMLMLEYEVNIPIFKLSYDRARKVLDDVGRVFKKHGIHLERDPFSGIRISNRKTLCEELRNLTISE